MAAWTSIAVGTAVIGGWIFDVAAVKRLAPGLVEMKPNSAIGLVLLGASLWLLRDEDGTERERVAGVALAAAIVVFAALTLVEYIAGLDLGIDHLFHDTSPLSSAPGRPSPHSAAAFLAFGAWFVALGQRGAGTRRWRHVLSIVTGVILLDALIGYLVGVEYLYANSSSSGMAVHTLATLAIVFVGALAARPSQGLVGLLVSPRAGGTVVRRLAPAVVVVPLLTAYLLLRAENHNLISMREGMAVLVGVTVVFLGAAVMYIALSLEQTDIDRSRLEARLTELSERDPLTNLYNRRRFDEAFEHDLAAAHRLGSCLALVLIDVDALKQTNDTHGHRAGDELLLCVARTLTSRVRVTDTVARLGGDEFGLLLNQVDPDTIESLTAKLVEAVRGCTCEVDGQVLLPTISAGLALSEAGRDGTADELSRAADTALFRAKDAGGDGYSIAPRRPLASA